MLSITPRRRHAMAVAAAAAAAVVPLAFASPALASEQTLAPSSHFFTPLPDQGGVRQVASLTAQRDLVDAYLVGREITTPQAVWFTKGTPQQVRGDVHKTVALAAATHTVPTLVAYDVPGRDCSQYSSGGAGSDTAYQAWARGFAAGLIRGQQITVVVEPDGLANLPSDCPSAYPGQDVAALTAGRIADIKYAGEQIEKADPSALVYLDAGHSAWHSVGDIAQRLDEAGVGEFQGFSLNVSNYQANPQLEKYGTWIGKCLYYANNPAEGGWRVGHYDYCASQYYPATASDFSTWGLTDAWYAANVDNAANPPADPGLLAHFVIDTSRNGQGPWTPAAGTNYPDPQDWCNPPGRGLGERPKADPVADLSQLDAFLWVKTPGQSDGQCNRGIAGSTTDPEWGGITDPAAGDWFPQQALQLAQLANPPLH